MADTISPKSDSDLWPTAYLGSIGGGASLPDEVALIILNSPISSYECFRQLYKHASFRMCADGGANRVHALLMSEHPESDELDVLRTLPPSVIHGDLDSLRPDVRKMYESIGVEISEDPDQYSTDFGKAVAETTERVPDVRDILVLGSLGGRVDQGLGLLGEMYREQKINHPGMRFWLFSEASVSTILMTGTTTLHTPLSEGLITPNVGILPIYGPSNITTSGLEWDVKDWRTEIGGNVSTSNHIVADEVKVRTTNDVLFTVEMASDR